MDIYIAIIEDRHADVTVCAFSSADKAIELAKDEALAGAGGDLDEINEQEIDGWLYFATYSREGDSVRVQKIVMDEKVA